jgi:hypothetical protein
MIGVFRPANMPFNQTTTGQWLPRNSVTPGTPDVSFFYGAPGDIPVVGDWTGGGVDTIGVFRPANTPFNQTTTGLWLLRSSNTPGGANYVSFYGAPGDIPVVGDWTGGGSDTIGVFRPANTPFNQTTTGQWLLRNSVTPGTPDISLFYGAPGDIPVVGDWTGIGTTTIDVFRPAYTPFNQTASDEWLLRNSNTPGAPDISFFYGAPGDIPVFGGLSAFVGAFGIGVYRPANMPFNQTASDEWLLRNSVTPGTPDISFFYGAPGDIPVVGDWTPP